MNCVKQILLLLALAIALASSESIANAQIKKEDCKSFRLDSASQPLNQFESKNQGYTGACYAAVATALYDYMRVVDQAKPVTDPSSMLAAALDYKTYLDEAPVVNGPEILDAGFAPQLLSYLVSHGACTNSIISKNLNLRSLSENQINDIYSVFTYRLSELRASYLKNQLNMDSVNACLKRFKHGLSEDLGAIHQFYATEACQSSDFLNRTDSLIHANPELACLSLTTLQKEFPLSCPDSERVKLHSHWELETQEFKLESPAQKMDYLGRVFFNSPDRKPIGVSFPYCILTHYDPSVPLETFYASKECKKGGHAALLIGQKWNQELGRCEVILRNSERKLDCSEYSGWNCNTERRTVSIEKSAFIAGIRSTTLPIHLSPKKVERKK